MKVVFGGLDDLGDLPGDLGVLPGDLGVLPGDLGVLLFAENIPPCLTRFVRLNDFAIFWAYAYCKYKILLCEDAVHLYEGAIERKYLPAYAPLAWMMSYSSPEKSLRLCDECIAVCDARSGVRFARKARIDCIAIRAFVQYQEAVDDLQEELEMMAPGGHQMVPEMNAAFMKKTHEFAIESMAEDSKYGYALQWLLLSHDFDRNETEIAQALKTAEEMGLDFERCRFC